MLVGSGHRYTQLESMEQGIRSYPVSALSKVHFDETGMRVNGQLWCAPCGLYGWVDYYFVHPKRGTVAMNEMAILT